MELIASLEGGEAEILDEAVTALDRSHLVHYERAGEDEDRRRLKTMFHTVLDGINKRQLSPIQQYGEKLARDRYHAGFDIAEVQTAFNVLEEAMWRRIVAVTPPDQLALAIGLLTTVLGAGKDALARTYVALATNQHVASINLGALFEGT
jgi:hypothetical protein